jgi:peptidoglycan/LPS O-acetylase OafA/YrhL
MSSICRRTARNIVHMNQVVKPSTTANHIHSLDILRGLAAFAVFASHFSQQFLQIPDMGWIGTALSLLGVIGVAVFFVLSGFLIHAGTMRELGKTGSINWRAYGRRRFFRIYPAYFIALLVYGLVNPFLHSNMVEDATLIGFASHALLISSFIPGEYQGINAIFWTVIVECHFYMLYPLVQKISGKMHPLAFFGLTWLAGMGFFVATSFITEAGPTRVMLQHTAPALFWKWTLGMLLAEISLSPRLAALRSILSNKWILAPTLLFIFLGTFWNSTTIELNYKRFILPFACFLLAGLLLFSACKNWRSKLGEWLGDVSYSFYLWHPLSLALVATWPLPSLPLNLAASLALSVGLAAASYYFIERPFIQVGKSLSSQ